MCDCWIRRYCSRDDRSSWIGDKSIGNTGYIRNWIHAWNGLNDHLECYGDNVEGAMEFNGIPTFGSTPGAETPLMVTLFGINAVPSGTKSVKVTVFAVVFPLF